MPTIFKSVKPFLPELASAAILSLAFPPVNLVLLAFVGLAPLLRALIEDSGKAAFWRGWRFGYVFYLIQLIWLGQFVFKWTQMAWIGILVTLLGPLVLCWVFGFAALAVNRAWQVRRPWIIPLVWLLAEFVVGRQGPFAFPWSPLALPLAQMPELVQWAAYGQIGLVSAWVCLASVCLVMVGQKWEPRVTARYVTVFLLMLVGTFALMLRPLPGRKLVVAAAQPGIDVAFGDRSQLASVCRDLYAQAAGANLVVFPERITEGGNPPFDPDPTLPALFGGSRTVETTTYQSAYTTAPKPAFADKTQLVIFGEYVPFRQYLPASFRLPQADLTPGETIRTLSVGEVRVGPQLCFEALFPHVGYSQTQQGAQLIAVMAIDDWYLGSAAPEQLQLASRIRAIESGLPLVRSATMGRSLIFDAFGRTVALAEYGQRRVIRATVQVPDGSPNPPARGWVPFLAAFMVLGGLTLRADRRPTPA
ncbi:MAG: apolipoprotein N-acyltransferase [Chthonomonas sp.]|nr:apolipoprotein N-acyltransferase [Chthonomonas sp.]